MSGDETVDPNAELSRDKVEIDGEEYRMYTDGEDEWPSVTTILNQREDPERDKSIQGWRNWLKGQPDRPDPDEVINFKSWRGTLAHWAALDDLARYELAGQEEFDALDNLKGWEYRHDDALTQAEADVDFVVEEFRDIVEENGIAQYDEDGNVTYSNVRAVEKYVVNEEIGYAGQFDLAYDLPDGRTVVADLKTSKADSASDLMDKKFPRIGMQLVAYSRAVNFDVDERHVIWIAPDTRESALITDSQWPESPETYEQEFLDLAETVHQETLDDY